MKLEGKNINIYNVYGPSVENERYPFFETLVENYDKSNDPNEYQVIAGDFNVVANNELDIISGNNHSTKSVNEFNNAMYSMNVFDVWRLFHPGEKAYTWCRQNPFIARRLDYILCNTITFNSTIGCDIRTFPETDHRGVSIEIQLTDIKRGPSYWKFNDFLLRDSDFTNIMNQHISMMIDAYEGFNNQVAWDLIKIGIREMTLSYSKNKAMNSRNKISQLRSELDATAKQLSVNPEDKTLQKAENELKFKLNILNVNHSKGAQIRARAKWIEEGEKNSKYFLGLEKSRGLAKIISKLSLETGEQVTDQQQVHNEICNYYRDLYSDNIKFPTQLSSFEKFSHDIDIPKLSEEDKDICEQQLTLEELGEALSKMKNGSSPGYDGLTTSFYKFFWGQIGKLVHGSFSVAFDIGQLSVSQRRAILVLIHKGKELPRDILSNWRPISLTNTDYKILAKALAIRLQTVIKVVIHEDQTAYIKGRTITTIIRLIDDVIETTKYNNKSGGILALDYRKAFDTISKDYLKKVLKVFNFGSTFVKWVSVLMENTESSVQHAGWLSDWFPTECGVRQGCPFSPLLFILGVELLAIKIRQNSGISGIELPNINGENGVLKIQQYADDTTLFTSCPQDVTNALSLVHQFSKFSGLYINICKSKGLWVGNEPAGGLPNAVKWCSDSETIKILGVHFSSTESASEMAMNWEGKIESIIKTIKQWEKRNLSIMGKIIVAKTFLISKLIYLLQGLCLPTYILKQIDTILYKFIWKKHFTEKKAFEKVKRAVVNANYEQGGLKMISVQDMQNTFLIKWVKNLILHENTKWATIAYSELNRLGGDLSIFHSNVDYKKLKGLELIKNKFWKSVLHVWVEHNSNLNVTHDLVPMYRRDDQRLWNNSNILYKGKVLFFPQWIKAGVFTVGHLFDESGAFCSIGAVRERVGAYPNLWFEYNALYNALPPEWKEKSETLQVTYKPQFWDNDITACDNNSIRSKIVSLKYTRPCSAGFWERKFDVDFHLKIWNIPFKCSKETRLQCLQWKIFNQSINQIQFC